MLYCELKADRRSREEDFWVTAGLPTLSYSPAVFGTFVLDANGGLVGVISG